MTHTGALSRHSCVFCVE